MKILVSVEVNAVSDRIIVAKKTLIGICVAKEYLLVLYLGSSTSTECQSKHFVQVTMIVYTVMKLLVMS